MEIIEDDDMFYCKKCGWSHIFMSPDPNDPEILVCTECGKKMMSWPREDKKSEEDDAYDDSLLVDYGDGSDSPFDDDFNNIPEGCKACGGPYPMCTDSCALFDE